MLAFPKRYVFNKEFNLNLLLRYVHADKIVRADAKKIDSVSLAYVLNASNLPCQKEEDYKEIYVFELILNTRERPEAFLKALDLSILLHTYFVCHYKDEISTSITYKTINRGKVILDKTFSHPFSQGQAETLPDFSEVSEAYLYLLSYETGVKPRKKENPEEYMIRVKELCKLEGEMRQLAKTIRREIQPHKKFTDNEKLRKCRREYEELRKEETSNEQEVRNEK